METAATGARRIEIRPSGDTLGAEVRGVDITSGLSEALPDRLWAHATQDRLVTTHSWRVGDLPMWDNRAVLHRAQLKGEGPIK